MKIGKSIRYFRSQKGVSQQWLADAIGISKMSISYFENDKRCPDIATVKRICSVLDVPLGKFMAFSDGVTLSDNFFRNLMNCQRFRKTPSLHKFAIRRSDTMMRALAQKWIAVRVRCQ